MKLVKARFERTEFGGQMVETVKALDFYLEEKSHTSQWQEPEKYKRLRKNIDRSFAQFEIFKLAVKQFYGVEYHFTRTDDYFGCCTEDGEDFLFRFERERKAERFSFSALRERKASGKELLKKLESLRNWKQPPTKRMKHMRLSRKIQRQRRHLIRHIKQNFRPWKSCSMVLWSSQTGRSTPKRPRKCFSQSGQS